MVRFYILAQGRVQGVGFRFFARQMQHLLGNRLDKKHIKAM